MSYKAPKLSFLLIGLMIVSACRDQPTPVSPPDSGPALHSTGLGPQQQRFRPGEEQSAALAQEIPGFGGFYIDEAGNLHAYVLDLKNAGKARAALARIIPETRRDLSPRESRRFVPQPQLVLHQGQYEFTQLADWRNRITDAILTVPGVAYNGLDEHVNRLAIGVERDRSSAARRAAEQKLDELGIPRSAVKFEDTDLMSGSAACAPDALICEDDPCTADPSSCESPSTDPCEEDPAICTDPGTIYPEDPSFSYMAPPDQYLYSKFSRLFGGIKIHNPSSGDACTLGFVARYRGVMVFATNSHCSASRGARDYSGSIFYQPDWNTPQVGQEVVDNGKMSAGRYVSDVSLVQIQNVPGYLGYIAQTWEQRGGLNSRAGTLIYSPQPYLKIISEVTPRKDYEFHKIGAKTGWTYGYNRKVCYDTSLMKCVSWVAAGAEGGDSGAPVFRHYLNGVGIAGLVYARADGGFWMTPMSQIRLDLNATGYAASDLRIY
jgi:hypothetical protein